MNDTTRPLAEAPIRINSGDYVTFRDQCATALDAGRTRPPRWAKTFSEQGVQNQFFPHCRPSRADRLGMDRWFTLWTEVRA